MKLLNAANCQGEVHLIVGAIASNNITFQRALKALEVDAKPVLIHDGEISQSLHNLVENDQLKWIKKSFEVEDLKKFGRPNVDFIVDKVFVVESNITEITFNACKRLRIPINTYQSQVYSTFTILSTFTKNDLQIGVTTSGMGCNLSSRIKREIIKSLPPNIDEIVSNIGSLRRQLIKADTHEEEDYSNEIVYEFSMSDEDKFLRRSRWLTQMIEYYPLSKLSTLSLDDFHQSKRQITQRRNQTGSITLVGSGPGSISCLTIGALNAIKTADLILIDKLIPQDILELIPRTTEQFISRKFPGNAEAAQQELYDLAIQGYLKGLKVVRLKQGDPFIYGRGGEETLYFQQQGIKVEILPGLTSALTAPLFARIPATHRGVVDKILICTGTGSKGSSISIPEYDSKRTTIFLMSIHRLDQLVQGMSNQKWDMEISCCVIEKASCPDQRVIRSKLKDIGFVMSKLGSRPPGLLVVGWSCGAIKSTEENELYEVVEGLDQVGDSCELNGVLNMIRKNC